MKYTVDFDSLIYKIITSQKHFRKTIINEHRSSMSVKLTEHFPKTKLARTDVSLNDVIEM